MVTLQYDYLNLVTWRKLINQTLTRNNGSATLSKTDKWLWIIHTLVNTQNKLSSGKQNFPEYCAISKPILDVELYRGYLYSLKNSGGQTEAARKPLKI